jgi:hypothetical protein
MNRSAYFQVDARLGTLLGANYRASEYALKELIDNAWDAEAEHVSVMLPDALTGGNIVIADDGSGMTEKEVRYELCWLHLTSARYSGVIWP